MERMVSISPFAAVVFLAAAVPPASPSSIAMNFLS